MYEYKYVEGQEGNEYNIGERKLKFNFVNFKICNVLRFGENLMKDAIQKLDLIKKVGRKYVGTYVL